MDYLRIRNWSKYQKIAGDKAPYVQVQTDILLDMEFMGLPDRERLCFLLLLAFAGRSMNKIPNDPQMVMHLCHFDDVPDMSLMMSRGLLEPWDEIKHTQAIEKEDERKAYERERKRQWRDKKKCPENVPAKSRLETETETETKKEKTRADTRAFQILKSKFGDKKGGSLAAALLKSHTGPQVLEILQRSEGKSDEYAWLRACCKLRLPDDPILLWQVQKAVGLSEEYHDLETQQAGIMAHIAADKALTAKAQAVLR